MGEFVFRTENLRVEKRDSSDDIEFVVTVDGIDNHVTVSADTAFELCIALSTELAR